MADLKIDTQETNTGDTQTTPEENKPEIKSTILSDEEVDKVLNDEEGKDDETEPELPSEKKEEEGKETDTEVQKELERLKKELEELKSNKGGVNEETLKEYAEKAITEGLKEDDYKELEKLGYDKDTVDVFVEGLKTKQTKSTEELLQGITTLDEYQEAVKWASENWDREQIEEFNTIIADGNPTAIRLIVRGLVKEAKGNLKEDIPLHTNTARAKPSVTTGYETKADMMQDVRDPRYGKDIAYTKKVEEKIKKTDTSKWYQ